MIAARLIPDGARRKGGAVCQRGQLCLQLGPPVILRIHCSKETGQQHIIMEQRKGNRTGVKLEFAANEIAALYRGSNHSHAVLRRFAHRMVDDLLRQVPAVHNLYGVDHIDLFVFFGPGLEIGGSLNERRDLLLTHGDLHPGQLLFKLRILPLGKPGRGYRDGQRRGFGRNKIGFHNGFQTFRRHIAPNVCEKTSSL